MYAIVVRPSRRIYASYKTALVAQSWCGGRKHYSEYQSQTGVRQTREEFGDGPFVLQNRHPIICCHQRQRFSEFDWCVTSACFNQQEGRKSDILLSFCSIASPLLQLCICVAGLGSLEAVAAHGKYTRCKLCHPATGSGLLTSANISVDKSCINADSGWSASHNPDCGSARSESCFFVPSC